MSASEPDIIIDDIDAEYEIESKRDAEVLHEMEIASSNYRAWCNKEETSVVSSKLRDITNLLPPIVRDSAIDTYVAYSSLREHYDDVHELLLAEFRMLDSNRMAMRKFDPCSFKKLSPKYRNNFARSCKRLHERKARLAIRIARTREKISYLDKRVLAHEGGPPAAPQPCSLCYIEGTGTLVLPKSQPACSNVNCQFCICMDCFHKLKIGTNIREQVKCPGCRSNFVMKGLFTICRKEYMDPFNIISDDDSDDSVGDVVVDNSEEEL